jgi:hypothetical protein
MAQSLAEHTTITIVPRLDVETSSVFGGLFSLLNLQWDTIYS